MRVSFPIARIVIRIAHGNNTPILRVVPLSHSFDISALLRAPRRGQEIDEESENVEGEDEGDEPLEHGGDVLLDGEGREGEDDGEDDFDDDEGEFGPEGEAQDAVLAEVDAEALVLGADEDGGDDVAGDEEEEEAVVEVRVVQGVEDREED